MSKDNQTITTSESQRKKKRVQLKHVLIDVDFFDKPKIRALAFAYPTNGVTVLLHSYAMMSRATGGVIQEQAILGLAKQWDIPDGKEFLTYCLDYGLIHRVGDAFSNTRVERDQERCAEEREKAIDRKQKFVEKTRSERVRNDSGTVSPVTVSVTDPDPDHTPKDPNVHVDEFGQIKKPPHCQMSVIDFDQFCATKGDQFLDRCFEKANAWVEEARGTPDFHDRRRRAQNCSALFQNWVFTAVALEQDRAVRGVVKGKVKETQAEKEARIARM